MIMNARTSAITLCAAALVAASAAAQEPSSSRKPAPFEVTIYPILVEAPIFGASINLPEVPSHQGPPPSQQDQNFAGSSVPHGMGQSKSSRRRRRKRKNKGSDASQNAQAGGDQTIASIQGSAGSPAPQPPQPQSFQAGAQQRAVDLRVLELAGIGHAHHAGPEVEGRQPARVRPWRC